MNRQERRNLKKREEKPISNKKLMSWIKGLNKDQQKLINQYTNLVSEKNFDRLTHSLDLNFTAAMVLRTDLCIDDIGKIFEDVFILMKDDREKDEALKRKFKSEEEFLAHMKDLEKEVSTRITQLIEEGLKDKAIREKLFLEFPSLSKSKITNCVKKVREITKQSEKMKDAVDKIMNIIDTPAKKEKVEEPKVEEVKEEPKVEEVKEEPKVEEPTVEVPFEAPIVEEVVSAPALKISKMEIKGSYATYNTEGKRVSVKLDKKFNKDTWEKFKAEVDAVFSML